MASRLPFSPMASIVRLGRMYSRCASPVAFLARGFIGRAGKLCLNASRESFCLDLGAGTAPYKEEVCRALGVARYVAIDIAPTDQTNIVADVCRMPFKGERADLVVSFDVIQHVSTPTAMLDEIARVLVHGGHVLLTFPFLYPECDFRDFHRWTSDGIRRELTARGIECILIEQRGGPCFAVACALNWALQHLLPGQREAWRAKHSWKSVIRAGIVTALTLPTVLLCWLALVVDCWLPATGFYMGGAVVARKVARCRA